MFTFFGMAFSAVIGVLLRFSFIWSGRNTVIAFLAPTNGSIFEKLKMLFTPYIIWALAEYEAFGYVTKSYIPAKTISVLAGMLMMILFFWFYVKWFKKQSLCADFLILAVGILFSSGICRLLLPAAVLSTFSAVLLCDTLLIALALTFAAFTVYPPDRWLFRDQNS